MAELLKSYIELEDTTIEELYMARDSSMDEEFINMIDDIIFEREEYSISYDEIADIVGGGY